MSKHSIDEDFENLSGGTSFNDVVSILGELYSERFDDEYFEQFVELHDVAVPLAFLIDKGYVISISDEAPKWIALSWQAFLTQLGVGEKKQKYKSLADLLKKAKYVEGTIDINDFDDVLLLEEDDDDK